MALTTTGLWAWGFEGGIFDAGLTAGTAFNKINTPIGGDATTKLPIGVTPTNVSMLFDNAQLIEDNPLIHNKQLQYYNGILQQ